MTGRWAVVALAAGVTGLGTGLAAAVRAGEPEAKPAWTRVRHPEMPLTFEVPEGTVMRRASVFSFGRLVHRERGRVPLTLFGIRRLADAPIGFHAIEVVFFWVSDVMEGADAGSLVRLHEGPVETRRVERFLRAVLYARTPQVSLEDAGLETVDGDPARRIRIRRAIAPGTPDARDVEGEAVVLPLPGAAALVVVARFDPASSAEERERVFPRLVRSVRIGVPHEPPLPAARPRPRGAREPLG